MKRIVAQPHLVPYRVIWRQVGHDDTPFHSSVKACSALEACRISTASVRRATGPKFRRWKLVAVI